MILKSLLRTYFINIAINTLVEKLMWNLTIPELKTYPRTWQGINQAIDDKTIFITPDLPLNKESFIACVGRKDANYAIEVIETLVRNAGWAPRFV